MSANTEDWARAGFHEVNGELLRINDAKRTVSEIAAAGTGDKRHCGATIEEAEDTPNGSELPHTEHQKFQDVADEAAEREAAQEADPDCETGVPTLEREGRGQFGISVVIKVSNYGRRDPTGALETICDLITATRRRLSERLAKRQLVGPIGESRRRRGRNHAGKAVTKVPF